MATKHGLGRGLGALIKDSPQPMQPTPSQEVSPGAVVTLPISTLQRNTLQPRTDFDPGTLAELVASIREKGILQPLLVRQVGSSYELIAGERRLRAAAEAGLSEVPVILTRASDADSLLIALIENLQRDDLNVIEEASGYQMLATRFLLTQEQIAQRVGKSRPSVANALRILDLPPEVREMVASDRISAGHAKVLIGVEIAAEQLALANRAVRDGLSVRQLETLVQKVRAAPRKPRASRSDVPSDHLAYLSDRLHQHFGTAVRITPCRTYANGKKAKGTVEVDFYSNDDLDRLLQILGIGDL